MVSLHMFLLQHRLRGEGAAAYDIAQILIDDFFTDVDHSLRELGVGDMGVPKRMKKLAKMYYGRTAAYSDALDRGDSDALTAALARNIRPELSVWPEAAQLSRYAQEAQRVLADQVTEKILEGTLRFPSPSAS